MSQNELKNTLEQACVAIDSFLETQQPFVVPTADPNLLGIAERLSKGLYVLLPPRGPSTTVDCPHCGNPVKVSLSK
jgi:hypothetical protein